MIRMPIARSINTHLSLGPTENMYGNPDTDNGMKSAKIVTGGDREDAN
jgi:hypothetical protein